MKRSRLPEQNTASDQAVIAQMVAELKLPLAIVSGRTTEGLDQLPIPDLISFARQLYADKVFWARLPEIVEADNGNSQTKQSLKEWLGSILDKIR